MRTTAVVLILGAALVAGCGGDDGDGAEVAPASTPAGTEAAVVTTEASTTTETSATTTTEAATTTTEPATTTTTEPATTTTAEATTTTTIDPLTLSQGSYFVLASNRNKAVIDLDARYVQGGGIAWANYPDFCREAAAVEEQWIQDLQSIDWIPSAQQAIEGLIAVTVTLVGQYYQCAATTGEQALADIDAVIYETIQEVGAAASAVRFALDLPIER